MGTTVSTGMFWGFTQTELDAEKAKYIAAVKQRTAGFEVTGGGQIVSSSIEGESFTFSFPMGINSFDHWRTELENAQTDLDDETTFKTNRTVFAVR